MIKRIVMMPVIPGMENRFQEKFDTVREEIRSHPGCQGLELLSSSKDEETSFWTISLWQSVDDLETYRASALFQSTWTEVKPLFSGKPMAWTLTQISEQ